MNQDFDSILDFDKMLSLRGDSAVSGETTREVRTMRTTKTTGPQGAKTVTTRESSNAQKADTGVVVVPSMENLRVLKLDKDMPDDVQRYIVELAKESQRQFSVEKDIAKFVKLKLDEQYERAWHVVVGRFQYGSFVTHEIACMFHFWIGRFAFLIWKTPDY